MNVDLASVIWDELKRYINTVDRAEAAENFVNVLIDNDCDPSDIKDVFKHDSEIKRALTSYFDNDQNYEEDDEYEEDEDDEDNWEN